MIRSLAILLAVIAVVGGATFAASRQALQLYGPPAAARPAGDAVCPPRRPVFVSAHRRGDSVEVRAHCRAKTSAWHRVVRVLRGG